MINIPISEKCKKLQKSLIGVYKNRIKVYNISEDKFSEDKFTKKGGYMFVGRENEIKKINSFLEKKKSLIVYGLRRIGKTTLIKKVLEEGKYNYVYFECQKASESINVSLFVDVLKEKLSFVDAKFETFLSVFKELDKLYKNYIFVIDEYSYLKQYYLESKASDTKRLAEQLDSEFQTIIDEHLKNINLIVSGSSIHIMERLLDHESPLYGRFDDKIVLRQFSYLDAKKMFNNTSNIDVINYYSIFGGSPFVLEKIDEKKSLKENICDLILNESGSLRMHLKNNVINELEGDVDLHNVLDVIKNGSKKYSEIEAQCHIETSGLLDKRLKKLLELDIIEAKFPIGRENDKRKKYYQIKDNLLKFYYAYVFRQDNRIDLLGESRYYDVYIEPSITNFISRRFENIVRDYFSLAIKRGMYSDIIDIGSYFSSNSELDCVLKKKDGTYSVFEVKYYTKPLTKEIVKKEISQIEKIVGLNINEIGFVSTSDYESKLDEIKYLDLKDIFFE